VPKPRLYDWDVLFGKRRFTLVRGRHYTCTDEAMRQQVRNAAGYRQVPINIVMEPGRVKVTLTAPAAPLPVTADKARVRR
jgi:hypothetical protein